MSTPDARIQALLEDILESGVSAEDACKDAPHLLPHIKHRLSQVRELEAEIDAVLPSGNPDIRAARHRLQRTAAKLPTIPGYHVESIIGAGGMGVVYRARHLQLNRPVAIKMLLAGGYAGPHELQRFKREAESIAALCHPNIVQVFDAGECDGHPYFVMEFMDGGSLAQILAGHPQPAKQSTDQITRLARAVHAAHASGIVHRDLKPANILLAADGTLKIADFGLARRSNQSDEASAMLTLAGARMGTPSYMSPEQALGAATAFCPLVDIYALGAILYEMLTGRPPFRGENPAETERQVIAVDPVPPSRLTPNTPRDLQTICLKCLQKDPDRRYPSASDLADDLERFARGEAIHARPVSGFERSMKWARRHPSATALAATLVAVLFAAIALGAWYQRLQNARHTEAAIRTGGARDAIESAIKLVGTLRKDQRWGEAQSVVDNALSRIAEARSPALLARLYSAANDLHIAHELDQIRQNYPEPNVEGYNFNPAGDAYLALFDRLGIGPDVPAEQAADIIRASAIRDEILIGLDSAAFIHRVQDAQPQLERQLELARLADPDPWRDRFRDPSAWRDRESLLKLVEDARSSGLAAPPHQLVIIGVLLNGLGAQAETIRILREAQYRNPSDFWVNLELGNALDRAGNHILAYQYYRAAIAIHPTNYVAWTTLGSLLRIHNEAEASIAPLLKATELNPRFGFAWAQLVTAYADIQQWDKSTATFDHAWSLLPGDRMLAEARDMRGLLHGRFFTYRADWKPGLDQYKPSMEGRLFTESEPWFEFAAINLLAGDQDGYRQACAHMLEHARNGPMRKFLLIRAYTLTTHSPQSLALPIELGMRELAGSPSTAWSLTEQAAILCRTNRPSEALPLLHRAIQADPAPGAAVIAWCWLARSHLDLGDTAECERWLRQATDWLDAQQGMMPKSIHLHNWLEAHILRQEITTQLRARTSSPPPSAESTPLSR